VALLLGDFLVFLRRGLGESGVHRAVRRAHLPEMAIKQYNGQAAQDNGRKQLELAQVVCRIFPKV